MTDTAPVIDTAFLAAAATADLEDWGPLEEATSAGTPDGGTPVTIGPGDVAVFPRGWRGPWELHETVRKVYVVF